jgi:serine/threonine protein phosphatase PrpC
MYLPIFLVWDETMPQSFAESVKSELRRISEDFLPSRNLEAYIHATYLASEGSHSTGKHYKSNEFPYTELISGQVAKSAGLSFDLANLPITRVKQTITADEGKTDSLPPIVLLLVNRQLTDVYFPDKAVRNLLDHDSQPRLAIIGTNTESAWKLPVELLENKKVLAYSNSTSETDIQASIQKVERFIEGKLSERRGSPAIESNPARGPQDSQPVQQPSVQQPIQPTRPVISIAPETTKKSAQNEPAAVVRPSIDISGVGKAALTHSEPPKSANEGSHSVSLPRLSTTPSATPPPPIEEKWEPPVKEPEKKSRKQKKKERKDLRRGRRIEPVSADLPAVDSVAESEDLDHTSGAVADVDIVGYSNLPSSWPSEETTEDGQIVIDHPSSLNARPWYSPKWKKLPARGPSRDLELDLGSLGDLRVIAGSTRGTKHQYYGEENQDSFYVARTKDSNFLVVAVADGVGSAEYSSYGSRFITHFVANSLARDLNENPEISTGAIQKLIRRFVTEASDRMQQWRPGDLYAPSIEPTEDNKNIVSSTLCLAIVPTIAAENGDRSIVLACVGDSPCYTLNNEGWTIQSFATKEGELLEHGTHALPAALGATPLMDIISFEMKSSDVLVLMTDGIGTSLANGDTPVGRWLAPRLYGPQLMTDFIHVLDYVQTLTADRQGEDDDRTLMVVYDFEGVQLALANQMESSEISIDSSDVAARNA